MAKEELQNRQEGHNDDGSVPDVALLMFLSYQPASIASSVRPSVRLIASERVGQLGDPIPYRSGRDARKKEKK